ncbi:hypothetical protein P692DRAFT_20933651 [Suillus brevipes Sb2]|jgi:hypothetical protein|nr:hypothetical protein P692DRAFT_20933651 [Suillus brevipes Sb2]
MTKLHDLQEFNANENAYQAAHAQHEDCTSTQFGISLTHDAFCDIYSVTTRLDGGATHVRGKYEGICCYSLRNLMYVHFWASQFLRCGFFSYSVSIGPVNNPRYVQWHQSNFF